MNQGITKFILTIIILDACAILLQYLMGIDWYRSLTLELLIMIAGKVILDN